MTKRKRQKLAPNSRAQGRKTIESCADHETASSAAVITDWFEVMILVQQRPLQFLYDRLLQMLNDWCHLRTAIGRIQWRSVEVRLLKFSLCFQCSVYSNRLPSIYSQGHPEYFWTHYAHRTKQIFQKLTKLCSFNYSLLSLLTIKIFHGWFYFSDLEGLLEERGCGEHLADQTYTRPLKDGVTSCLITGLYIAPFSADWFHFQANPADKLCYLLCHWNASTDLVGHHVCFVFQPFLTFLIQLMILFF